MIDYVWWFSCCEWCSSGRQDIQWLITCDDLVVVNDVLVDVKTYNAVLSCVATQHSIVEDKWRHVLVCHVYFCWSSCQSLLRSFPPNWLKHSTIDSHVKNTLNTWCSLVCALLCCRHVLTGSIEGHGDAGSRAGRRHVWLCAVCIDSAQETRSIADVVDASTQWVEPLWTRY